VETWLRLAALMSLPRLLSSFQLFCVETFQPICLCLPALLPTPHTNSLAAVAERSPAQRSGAEAARHPLDPLNRGALS
jgi:hypothetical protein